MADNSDLKLTISTGRSRKETQWTPRSTTWGKLCRKLQSAVTTDETMEYYAEASKDERAEIKDVGGYVCGLVEGSRTADHIKYRQIVSLDVDYPPEDLPDDYGMLGTYECLMHTTHSSTPENPRYRMLFPLTRAVSGEEYPAVARMLAKQLGYSMDIYDETAYMVQQLMYWPSVSLDADYGVWHFDGDLADPDSLLGLYHDWHNTDEWPRSSRVSPDAVRPKTGNRQTDPRDKTGLIGAFCRVYDIPQAIDKYLSDIYQPVEGSPSRYTYINGHTTGGLALYGPHDNRYNPPYLYAYSHHDTDPVSGLECNAWDLVRISRFGKDGTMDQMRELLQSDDAVQDEYIASQKARDAQMFDDAMLVDDLARDRHDLTEQGNAARFADRYSEYLCYNGSLGWSVWSGSLWQQADGNNEIAQKLLMRLNDENKAEAIARLKLVKEPTEGEKPSEEYKKAKAAYTWWVKTARSGTTINRVVNLAKGIMRKDTAVFDGNPWVLNTPGCMIDLRTADELPHERKAYCTKTTYLTPNFEMETPEWDAFLSRVTGGDSDLIEYLQNVAGMALVGKVYEEALVIVYGPGGNGKSTLFEVWQRVMGDYAGTMRNEVLIGGPNGTEVAGQNQLRGKRLVIMGELEEDRLVSSSLIKRLTSRDQINANVKFHEPITFIPSHTLILHTNHLPRLRGVDGGIIRRIAIVPFRTKFQPSEIISDMAGYLVEKEGAGILAWMIRGAGNFYNNHMKLKKPAVVLQASESYLQSEDRVNRFLMECCIQDGSAETNTANLFQAFKRWNMENDLKWSGGSISFRKALAEKGYEIRHTSKGNAIKGIALSDEYEL